MIPTIYYHPEAYSISSPKLMGRNAAGESFLRGYLKYNSSKEFWALVEDPSHANDFAKKVINSGRNEIARSIHKSRLGALAESELLFFPGPDIGQQSFYRTAYGSSAWSLCGITHTTSSSRAMDSIVSILTSPVQPWDAIICTSTAVKNNVEKVLQAQLNYLQDRLGITKFVMPQLPVIPLGIHTDDFAFSKDQKNEFRQNLGISDQSIVVLYMGRLSFHAKANPLAMYQALEKAVKTSNKEVILIECGWHATSNIEKIYKETALKFCPSLRVIRLDGRKEEDRKTAWASADIFCSLSDNIQETFGIVPIEAMAAKLPVVVSDWDGYKDTVRDGIDGFRSPTYMPQAGLGKDLAFRHAMELDNYDMYCGITCSLISVDIAATAKAFERLFLSKELRIKMGTAGHKRAKENYEWEVIINQYEKLWKELKTKKDENKKIRPMKYPWPARMDPFEAFSSYPTKNISLKSVLTLSEKNSKEAFNKALIFRDLNMVNFAKLIIPSEEEIKIIISSLEGGPQTADKIIKNFDQEKRFFVLRSLGWLLKVGILSKVA